MRKDFIEKKQKELIALGNESQDALDMVTNTIHRLSSINDRIDVVVQEIVEAEDKLSYTREELNKNKAHNESIITKFKNLIEV